MLRRGQLTRNLAAILALFFLLQLSLVLKDSCEEPNTVKQKEKSEQDIKQVERVNDLLDSARLRFIEQNAERQVDADAALMYGVPRPSPGFLAIGIPSIRRRNVTYIVDTVASLCKHANVNDRKEIVVVVFLSDFNVTYRVEMGKLFKDRFAKEIDEGFIHIIQAPGEFYPNMDSLERTFGDKEVRVKWRSKQNYDYAYVMKYSQPLAQYYMQLEDDVITKPNYLFHIKKFVRKQKKRWSCIEFSDLGFIGKLFPTSDLGRLAKFLMIFFDQQPVDLLFPYFFRLMTQKKPLVSRPSLFQHMGELSSLQANKNSLKDKYFNARVKEIEGHNPAALLYTSLQSFQENTLERAYDAEDTVGYFWGKTPKKGDWFSIVFESPQTITRIAIITGNPEHPGDRLLSGTVEVSPKVEKKMHNSFVCRGFRSLGNFTNGNFDLRSVSFKTQVPVMCIRITVGADQETWLIIREIAVFTVH